MHYKKISLLIATALYSCQYEPTNATEAPKCPQVTKECTLSQKSLEARLGHELFILELSTEPTQVQLSNGMSVYGIKHMGMYAKTLDDTFKVFDEGNGKVYVMYYDESDTPKLLPNLTYSYGVEKFPVWEPYAFRESLAYRRFQGELWEKLQEQEERRKNQTEKEK